MGRPMERTITEPSRPYAPQPYNRPQTVPGGRVFGGSPFMSGLLGGLIGVGLGGLLFGHGLFGGGFGFGFASFLGLLLQIVLIVMLVRFALNFFRRRMGEPAFAGGPQGMFAGMARQMQPGSGYGGAGGGGPAQGPVRLEKADFDSFEQTLKGVNAAWSRQDIGALRRLCTPEMVQYFADDLAALRNRGLRNETRDVVLEQGDLAEAWQEAGRDYATVAMRFSLLDATFDAANRVVEGSTTQRSQATELWTFVRVQGGPWQLSAIQQTG
jgi:predicted lipid-binding transport protein (Tim44 family)